MIGEEVGFRVQSHGDVGFYHPGVAQIWLSRAPNDDLKKYHGDGDFFKIAYAGPIDDFHWSLYDDGRDDGERVEHKDVGEIQSADSAADIPSSISQCHAPRRRVLT